MTKTEVKFQIGSFKMEGYIDLPLDKVRYKDIKNYLSEYSDCEIYFFYYDDVLK